MAFNQSVNDQFQRESIALWGPTGSGKDWLFRAFARELAFHNRIDHEFHYEIGEQLPGEIGVTPLGGDPPLPRATSFSEDHTYSFQRVAMIQDPAHQLSAQSHDIIIHNDKGANLVDSLNDQYTFETTFQTLINSRNILLILGIPREDMTGPAAEQAPAPVREVDTFSTVMDEISDPAGSNFDQPHSEVALRQDWTRAEYLKFMQLLLARLSLISERNLAVCLTKSDQNPFRGEPWQILERRYGAALRRLLEVNRQRHNIEVFITSAAGYLKQDGGQVPNIQRGAIRDTNRWNPVNTSSPFFWIFERIERERLNKGFILFRGNSQQKYRPYPRPRPF